ncbi:putative inactive receptor kinase [Raphanus sativus]|nr:putative inactive receptor kinase [Raphanus sativus]
MVYDYLSDGSVASLLHGNRGENRVPLDWETRMKIAIGAAKGIARIHRENNGKLVHGNVKSSNIFLNAERNGCVSDLGLTAVMSALAPPISRQAGYRAPKYQTQGSLLSYQMFTASASFYSNCSRENRRFTLPQEWTAEVFDVELLRYTNIEEEMVEMLQIALSCVVKAPDQRPKMSDLVSLMEGVGNRRASLETKPEKKASETSTPSET